MNERKRIADPEQSRVRERDARAVYRANQGHLVSVSTRSHGHSPIAGIGGSAPQGRNVTCTHCRDTHTPAAGTRPGVVWFTNEGGKDAQQEAEYEAGHHILAHARAGEATVRLPLPGRYVAYWGWTGQVVSTSAHTAVLELTPAALAALVDEARHAVNDRRPEDRNAYNASIRCWDLVNRLGLHRIQNEEGRA